MIVRRKSGQIPEEIKRKALSMLETEDINTVATALRIRKSALLKMIEDATSVSESVPAEEPDVDAYAPTETASYSQPAEEAKPSRFYTPEFKAAALAMMAEKGPVATIRELGISSYTLYDWKNKADGQKYPRRQGPLAGKSRKRYTPEFKAEVLEYYQTHGAGETTRTYDIVNNTLFNWLNEAGITRVGRSYVDHSDAIALYKEKGADAVLEKFGITKETLREWLKDAGIDPNPPKYTPEFKERALKMLETAGITAVAKELNIPVTTLYNWKTRTPKTK